MCKIHQRSITLENTLKTRILLLVAIALTLGLLSSQSPVLAAAGCSCNQTCDNGTSCTASGVSGCACYCSTQTGNAKCQGGGITATVASGGVTLLVEKIDAVQRVVQATVSQSAPLQQLLDQASHSLILQDYAQYESILDAIDLLVTSNIDPDEDLECAKVLRSLMH